MARDDDQVHENRGEPTGGLLARLRRRRFLSAVSTGTAALAAGCTTVRTVEASAEPVVLTESARTSFGAVAAEGQAVTDTFERTIGGVAVRAHVTSHLGLYSLGGGRGTVRFGDGNRGRRPPTDGTEDGSRAGGGRRGNLGDARIDARGVLATSLTVGVLASPSATFVGRELNPLAAEELATLLAAEPGRRLLRAFGYDLGRVLEPLVVIMPDDLDGALGLAGPAGAGEHDDLVGFVTVIDDGGTPTLVFGNVVRARRGESSDDVVLAAGVRHRAVPAAMGANGIRGSLIGGDGVIAGAALATTVRQTAAVLPHLQAPGSGRRPFAPGATPDPGLRPGEYVTDATSDVPDLAVTLALPGAPIDDWLVYGEETVADHNPANDPTEPVVIVAYERLLDEGWPDWRAAPTGSLFDGTVARGVKFHAFPRSRLARHLVTVGDQP